MHLRIIHPASIEFMEAIDYYNAERPGLGIEFAHEIRLTLSRIRAHPFAWTSIDKVYRRCPADRFPYSTLYKVEQQEIIIVAFMHYKRKPLYWQDRIDGI